MKISKPKRHVDEELLEEIRGSRCIISGCYSSAEPHHVTTRKAGGGDTRDNLMPLCRRHHTDIHKMGPRTMCERHPEVLEWLQRMGRVDVLARMRRSLGQGHDQEKEGYDSKSAITEEGLKDAVQEGIQQASDDFFGINPFNNRQEK